MKVLGFTAQSRVIPSVLLGIHNLQWNDVLHWRFSRGGDVPGQKSESCYRKALDIRRVILSSDYDALFIVDDDTLIPPDTLERLVAHEADIAYALYIRRDKGHHWTASHYIGERELDPYGTRDGDMQSAWGKVIEVAGVGTGCTLVHRHVLERIPFARRGIHGYDFYLAVDAYRAGLRQVCDTTLNIGHIDVDQNVIYYPSPDGYVVKPYDCATLITTG